MKERRQEEVLEDKIVPNLLSNDLFESQFHAHAKSFLLVMMHVDLLSTPPCLILLPGIALALKSCLWFCFLENLV